MTADELDAELVTVAGENSYLLFAKRVQEVIEDSGGIGALARKSGIPERTIRKWADGVSDPSRQRLVKLAKAAPVNVAWLATGEEPKRGAPLLNSYATPFGVAEGQVGISPSVVHARQDAYQEARSAWLALERFVQSRGLQLSPEKKAAAADLIAQVHARHLADGESIDSFIERLIELAA
ncbi:helix-turn-helix transcriptional regulator [Algiphilus sp. W345]|uniref:Helix-turn-helix transcriptional regulator n=1 Tax=Banduia mediterranea TaxID=3075609 RepID=A0ABU2WFT9_9GAMM|nr:helix-turn-helix transcriptional regulator [Algiphilus sp. W345]MDT0496484.1 helix-turn-helix transcriptional regulator [Algiphilus sp. W345]